MYKKLTKFITSAGFLTSPLLVASSVTSSSKPEELGEITTKKQVAQSKWEKFANWYVSRIWDIKQGDRVIRSDYYRLQSEIKGAARKNLKKQLAFALSRHLLKIIGNKKISYEITLQNLKKAFFKLNKIEYSIDEFACAERWNEFIRWYASWILDVNKPYRVLKTNYDKSLIKFYQTPWRENGMLHYKNYHLLALKKGNYEDFYKTAEVLKRQFGGVHKIKNRDQKYRILKIEHLDASQSYKCVKGGGKFITWYAAQTYELHHKNLASIRSNYARSENEYARAQKGDANFLQKQLNYAKYYHFLAIKENRKKDFKSTRNWLKNIFKTIYQANARPTSYKAWNNFTNWYTKNIFTAQQEGILKNQLKAQRFFEANAKKLKQTLARNKKLYNKNYLDFTMSAHLLKVKNGNKYFKDQIEQLKALYAQWQKAKATSK